MHMTLKGAVGATVLGAIVSGGSGVQAQDVVPCATPRTYTSDADFAEGTIVNLNLNVPGQLQVNPTGETETFPFIWVAASARGTIVKIDTATGAILGEYLSSPDGRARNPSRTTIDANGAVWAGNRDEASGGRGSVVQIGLVEGCDCVDRNGNGVIDTSTGLGDIRPWSNPGGVDDNGGVSSAEDECILKYVRVEADNVRHVSVDAANRIWVAGNFGADNRFELLDNATGAVLSTFDVGSGGYGGLTTASGVIWSANRGPGPITVLRYDTKNTLDTADDTWMNLDAPNAYGLALDSFGNAYNAQWTSNQLRQYAPDGALLNIWASGGSGGNRGVAVTAVDNHVWIANSNGSDVSRIDPATGAVVKVVPLGGDGVTPTGVAVDAAGKVWATCLTSSTAKRIDPNAGADGLGAVDLTVSLGAGAGPYNYSDMTGSVLLQAIPQGTWTVVHDGAKPGTPWTTVSWNEEACDEPPAGAEIGVVARAADTVIGLASQPFIAVTNGGSIVGLSGRYVQVRATLTAATEPFASPALCDLTIGSRCTLDGDLNCDESIDSDDVAIVLARWRETGPNVADLNVDGIVDPFDLAIVLANWGPCPR